MTKEELSLKIQISALVLGVCGGVAMAFGNPGSPVKSLLIGLLIGLLITLHQWRKIVAVLTAEYKRLKKLEADKNKGCSEK